MIEAGVVLGENGNVIHWHLPPGRSGVYLPDSADLWNVLWDNRERIVGFAHTHPGSGVPGPSMEDLTTFVAVESGLGKPLIWWIASADCLIKVAMLSKLGAPGTALYAHEITTIPHKPVWLDELRWLSHINSTDTHTERK